MSEQLRLFKVTADELEQMAALVATLGGEIIGLENQRVEAREAYKETSEYLEYKDVDQQLKDAKDRLAEASARLRAASIDEP